MYQTTLLLCVSSIVLRDKIADKKYINFDFQYAPLNFTETQNLVNV